MIETPRLAAVPPRRSWLDRADHISALLATLTFAGLRIGEALSLRWCDVDLASGTITIRAAKTDAGVRSVNILPVLRDESGAYRARFGALPDVLVFGTAIGSRQTTTNIRRRVLAKDETEPLPERLTPHSLTRTFASLLFAIGEAPPMSWRRWGTPRQTSRWRSTYAAWTPATASRSV